MLWIAMIARPRSGMDGMTFMSGNARKVTKGAECDFGLTTNGYTVNSPHPLRNPRKRDWSGLFPPC
jgi:hypothetical protein